MIKKSRIQKLSKIQLQEVCDIMKIKYNKTKSKQQLIQILLKPFDRKYKMFNWFKRDDDKNDLSNDLTNKLKIRKKRPKTPPRKRNRNDKNSNELTKKKTRKKRPKTPPRKRELDRKTRIAREINNKIKHINKYFYIIGENVEYFSNRYRPINILGLQGFYDELNSYLYDFNKYMYEKISYLNEFDDVLKYISLDIENILSYEQQINIDYSRELRRQQKIEKEYNKMREKERKIEEDRRKQFEKLYREQQAKESRRQQEQKRRQQEQKRRQQEQNRRHQEQNRRQQEQNRRHQEQNRRHQEQRNKENLFQQVPREGIDPCEEYFPNHLVTLKNVTQAFRKQALIYHPDKGGDVEKFRKLKECYDIKKKKLE
jgi:hypothetical protein